MYPRGPRFIRRHRLGWGLAALLCVPSMAGAQVAPLMGVAEQFGALGNSAVTPSPMSNGCS